MKTLKSFMLSEKHKLTWDDSATPKLRRELKGALSEPTLQYHFDHLFQKYIDNFNEQATKSRPDESKLKWNWAGTVLHQIYFSNLQKPKQNNKPTGQVLSFIENHYNKPEAFIKEFTALSNDFKGSGWLYLSKSGTIKEIQKHEVRSDIVFIIDLWEHAWALDYKWEKDQYIDHFWNILDWDKVNKRIMGMI